MIFAVRLRPFNKKLGHGMRDYTSANSGTRYRVGVNGQPSPIKIVEDKKELQELREFPQFEIMPFDSRDELNDFVRTETETATRAGKPTLPPAIEEGPKPVSRTVSVLDDDDEDDDEDDGDSEAAAPPAPPAPPANSGRKAKKTSPKKAPSKKTASKRAKKKTAKKK
jgi:hypothetical protein